MDERITTEELAKAGEPVVELLPCPWCGFIPTLTKGAVGWRIGCGLAGCFIRPNTVEYHNPVKAIQAWNRRAPLSALSEAQAEAGEAEGDIGKGNAADL